MPNRVAPAKASSQKQATAQKGAPKARKSAKAAKPKKDARKIATPLTLEAGPRTGSKSAKVLSLLARPNGASLPELMKATGWQAHSVRGFLSTASRKRGLAIDSLKNGRGERVYRVEK